MYGLLERDLKYILEAVRKYPEIESVRLYGSRAMGNYKNGSDVDLAIKGERVDRNVVRRLSDDLNEVYPLPFFFDVVNYNEISNDALRNHIDTVGITIF